MIHRIPITKARINLGQLVRRVHLGKEYFILEKGGIPVAGIIDVDELEDYLELRNTALKAQIREGYDAYLQGNTRELKDFIAELEKEVKKVKSR